MAKSVTTPTYSGYSSRKRRDPGHDNRRQNQNGTRGGRIPAPCRTSARPHRRPEHRPDESGGVLPQLPVQLAQGRSRRQGGRLKQGREPRGRLRHAVRDLEGDLSGGRQSGAGGGDEEGPSRALIFFLPALSPSDVMVGHR